MVLIAFQNRSLARGQIDAHGDWKSNGNTLLTGEQMKSMGIDTLRHLFREFSKEHVYDFETHVKFAEELANYGKLPRTYIHGH